MRVAPRQEIGRQSIDFVSEEHRDRKTWAPVEEVDRLGARLHCRDLVVPPTKLVNVRQYLSLAFPLNMVLGAQGRLAELPMRWAPGDPREAYPLESHPVSGPEKGTDVVQAANIVEDHSDWKRSNAGAGLRQRRCGKRKTIEGIAHDWEP